MIRFDDTQLEEGKRYWYRVRAVDGSGNGRDTAYAPKKARQQWWQCPACVNGFASRPINLSWIDDSRTATHTTISVSTDDGAHFTPLADLGAGVASYR